MMRGWSFVPGKPEDCLLRIQHLQMELEADMKRIKQAEKEHAAAEKQLRQRKKEFGWND